MIILPRKNIDDEKVRNITQGLSSNSSVTAIDLSYNFIKCQGAAYICQFLIGTPSLSIPAELCGNSVPFPRELASNCNITSINLANNRIGCEGAYHLSQGLRVNSSITSINLRNNVLGAEGAIRFSDALRTNRSITAIDLSQNRIQEEGAIHLMTSLLTNKTLTSLDIQFNGIGLETIRHLSRVLLVNPILASVNLNVNSLGTDGAVEFSRILSTLTSIRSVHLNANFLGDEGLVQISQALRSNTVLTSIDLGNNGIGIEGARNLAETLLSNTSVRSLNLSGNDIGSKGGSLVCRALLERFHAKTIRHLVENYFSFRLNRQLARCITSNFWQGGELVKICLSRCNLTSDIRQVFGGVSLKDSVIKSLPSDVTSILSKILSLRDINLSYNKLSYISFKIFQLPLLENVNLSANADLCPFLKRVVDKDITPKRRIVELKQYSIEMKQQAVSNLQPNLMEAPSRDLRMTRSKSAELLGI